MNYFVFKIEFFDMPIFTLTPLALGVLLNFLRGFNLDHGTDFATFVDAMPVNMRTHGHSQGYTDLNFLIPESAIELDYRKGPYYADVGDFSSASSTRFGLADTLPQGFAQIDIGEYGYARGVLADSMQVAGEDFLYAFPCFRTAQPAREHALTVLM